MNLNFIIILLVASFDALALSANISTTFINTVYSENESNYETHLTPSASDPFNKSNFRNQVVEFSYTLIPESITHGADFQYDFISVPDKKSVFKFLVGLGGGYGQHQYKDHDFTEYRADVLMRRIYGRGTMGIRLFNRVGGLTIRSGYSYMAGMYEYEYNFPGGVNVLGAEEDQTKHYHRVHMEAVLFKSFSKRKPGVGILVGAQYLRAIKRDGQDVFLLKAGFGF